MKLSIQCPQCGAKLKASDQLVGRSVPCPKCKAPIVVENPETDSLVLLQDDPLVASPDADPLFDLGTVDLNTLPAADLSVGSSMLGVPLSNGSTYANSSLNTPQSAPDHPEDSDRGVKKLLLFGGGIGLAVVLLIGCGVWFALGSGTSKSEIAKAEPAASYSPESPETKSATPPSIATDKSSSPVVSKPNADSTNVLTTAAATAPTTATGTTDPQTTQGDNDLPPSEPIAPPAVAEAIKIGDYTTGASNDIQKATNLAREMVTQYGMTERLGAIKFGENNAEPFLGRDLGPARDGVDHHRVANPKGLLQQQEDAGQIALQRQEIQGPTRLGDDEAKGPKGKFRKLGAM